MLLAIIFVLISSLFGLSTREANPITQALHETQPGYYQVTKVDDGDTITVSLNGKVERVRLIGIDTPELHHPKKPVQCFAETARQFTAQLIGDNKVRLAADPEDDDRDIYRRLLRYVYLPDGTLVNTEIVRQGYGFAYTRYPFTRMEEMRALEQQARQQNLGLWASCSVEADDDSSETQPAAPSE